MNPAVPHTWPRLFVQEPLKTGVSLTLGPDSSHYLAHVLRVQMGDLIRLFNGRDGEWQARVSDIAKNKKGGITLFVTEQRRPQITEPDLWLCAAPIKKAHFDFTVEKAVELGVSVIQPVLTARTQIRDVNIQRLHALAIEAAEQSERLTVPEVRAPLTLDQLVSTWPKGRLPLLCAEFGNAKPIAEALGAPALTVSTPCAVLIGPEGGFAHDEMDKLQELPQCMAVRLGPRILRADTAALAALTCWQALCGDWRHKPSSGT